MTSGDMHVLSVSADHGLTCSLDRILSHGGHVHRSERTVNDARAAMAESKPHLLLLDIDLEEGAGIQLIDEARSCGGISVIALTRLGGLHRELDVYARGADDFVRVPFVQAELAARVGAVLRRRHDDGGVPRVCVGDLEIAAFDRRVLAGDHVLHLTALEQALLFLLAVNAGSVLSCDRILETLWGTDLPVKSNVVARHVRTLRAKLRDDRHEPRYIETVRGAGYRLVAASGAAPH